MRASRPAPSAPPAQGPKYPHKVRHRDGRRDHPEYQTNDWVERQPDAQAKEEHDDGYHEQQRRTRLPTIAR